VGLLVAVVACGDDGGGDGGDSGTASTGTNAASTGEAGPADSGSSEGGSTAGTPGAIPTPCADSTNVDVTEPDHEPNDTPEQATDLCTLDVSGVWTVSATIGGDDEVDYYVFNSAEGIGVVNFRVDPCWDPVMVVELYDVTDGTIGEPLWAGTTATPGCEDAPGAIPTDKAYLMRIAQDPAMPLPAGTAYGW